MQDKLRFRVVTPERVVCDVPADFIYLSTTDGSIGILRGHASMVSELEIAVAYFRHEQNTTNLAIMGGLATIDGDVVTVLTDSAELATEIDLLRAEQARLKASNKLREPGGDHLQNIDLDFQLKRAILRLKTAKQHR